MFVLGGPFTAQAWPYRPRANPKNQAWTNHSEFHNNAARMTYADFRARGLPSGSGPVEAAGKTLIKTRLGRSGKRWSRTGGQHLLNLRTLIKSDSWQPHLNPRPRQPASRLTPT